MFYLRLPLVLFLLPLLLVGIMFWVTGDLVTKQLLSLSYRTLDKLQADTLPQAQIKLNLTIVATEIEKEEKFTQVEIKTANSLIKKLEFEFPNSNSDFQELAIAQKLGLYPKIKKLEPNTQLQIELPITLKVIKAELQKEQGNSFVEIRTANEPLRMLEIVLPSAEVNIVEEMIAQITNLPLEEVRKLIRYQVKK
ncbi:MAG: hypothetical protein IGS49_16740 [Chlorogloeopsis fritschii C42_A2020_084]|uniref:hypothetical protein n=1 Tax=Chlorogloeopsis fritschii TaxID=1124 RepID=UPI0019F211E2|nr:hypothetical protein [Chlorogloeopsis fritschii]MBF2007064.1 hypothetical protein [Chlorogloeopsis fritschii C42_A2020_084]